MMNRLTFTNTFGEELTVVFRKAKYAQNGNLYIAAELEWEGPYCNITVNFPEVVDDNEAYLDVNNADRELLKAMEEAGYMTCLHRYKQSGFCQYPLYIFDEDFLESIVEIK